VAAGGERRVLQVGPVRRQYGHPRHEFYRRFFSFFARAMAQGHLEKGPAGCLSATALLGSRLFSSPYRAWSSTGFTRARALRFQNGVFTERSFIFFDHLPWVACFGRALEFLSVLLTKIARRRHRVGPGVDPGHLWNCIGTFCNRAFCVGILFTIPLFSLRSRL